MTKLSENISDRLNYSLRFSGSPIESPETVSQHIAAMQLIALELYNLALNRNIYINIKEIMYRIVLHDLDEAPMGDIPRPVKYHDDEILFHFNRVAKEELIKHYDYSIVNEVLNSKDDTFEGWTVNILDSIQCIARLRRSVSFSKSYEGMYRGSLEALRSKLDRMPSMGNDYELLREVAEYEFIED